MLVLNELMDTLSHNIRDRKPCDRVPLDISSAIVNEAARFGGSLDGLVPPLIEKH
jgi:hypothetical protein